MYQQQYWKELQDLKTHAYYLELYQLRCGRVDLIVNIVLAVASSSSIGAWAIWREAAVVWGGVIAASQVITVVYKLLPFKSRIKPLSSAGIELSALADEAEEGWYSVAEGELTEKEIHDKRMAIRKKKSLIMKSAFPSSTLPVSDRLMSAAQSQMTTYFNSYYPEV